MTSKRGLSKGLNALIPITESARAQSGIATAPLSAIARNPRQQRTARHE